MSRFFSERYASLTPYTPGEQPQERKYIKLNTNESPFPPSPGVAAAAAEEAGRLQLYSDPESKAVTAALAAHYGLKPDQILVGNGSDELLNFAFMSYCDETHPALFADITYGFYPVFCELNRIPYIEIPLTDDLRIETDAYIGWDGTVFIANPNAPTGLALSAAEIEALVKARPDRVHVIDEAYVDFGAESVLPLVDRYDNLLVIQTFSKSRSMAGARLGFAAGPAELIRDLNTLKYSTNPYNVNRMTSAAGIAALKENDYYRRNAKIIMENRSWTVTELRKLGFAVTDSFSNFLFARSDRISGGDYYRRLKERGILVRHFDKPRIDDYVRITVGTRDQMEALIRETKTLLGECAQ
ncbi:MAG: histidinol-phosphate transaminase [Oscillospiraceae bacterium]|nr:histidinol-phosphate transaminase [Oscillospiraceae bacterium]